MTAWLLVRRADLAREVARLARLARTARARHSRAEAVLTFSEGRLTIALPSMSVGVAADGIWVPRVQVQAHMLLDLGRHLPEEDPLLVKIQEGHLVIGGHAIPCQFGHPELSLIRLPANASLADILRVAATHSAEEIERSGLSRIVEQAQAVRLSLIKRAVAFLGPLTVSVEDLNHMVDERLRGEHGLTQPAAALPSAVVRVAAILEPLGLSADEIHQLVRDCVSSYQPDFWENEPH